MEFLRENQRTVILVTHQIQYLDRADKVTGQSKMKDVNNLVLCVYVIDAYLHDTGRAYMWSFVTEYFQTYVT